MTSSTFATAARGAVLGAAVAGFTATATLPARAVEPAVAPEEAVARLLLPFTPLVFDIAVAVGRSFAEITYDRRGYDPVTNSFYVNGLTVKRAPVDVTIGRLRNGLNGLVLERVSVDTRGIDLPPELRTALRRLGGNRVEGDILIGVDYDAARSGYDISMRYDLPAMGAISATARLDGFHVLVPLPGVNSFQRNPTVSGALAGASLAYEDYGLMRVAYELAAQQSRISPEQFKQGLLAMPAQVAAQALGSLPGGASPALRERVQGWVTTVEGFLRDEDAIRISLAPAEPLQLSRLQTGFVDEALVVALNPSVSPRFAAPLPDLALPGSMAAADAMISGEGLPQDRVAGARALLALAGGGDVAAVRALAASFGAAPAPALDPAEIGQLYGYLLVARALDGGIGDHVLDALTAALEPAAVVAAEREAVTYFTARAGGRLPVDAGSLTNLDADAVRAAAYDYYEGRAVPRSHTQALALALVASAAGDRFAAQLRDDLVTAAAAGAVVIDDASARAEAATMWTAYEAALRARQ